MHPRRHTGGVAGNPIYGEVLGSSRIFNGRLDTPLKVSRLEFDDGSKAVYAKNSPEGPVLDALEDQGIREKYFDALSWPIVMEETAN